MLSWSLSEPQKHPEPPPPLHQGELGRLSIKRQNHHGPNTSTLQVRLNCLFFSFKFQSTKYFKLPLLITYHRLSTMFSTPISVVLLALPVIILQTHVAVQALPAITTIMTGVQLGAGRVSSFNPSNSDNHGNCNNNVMPPNNPTVSRWVYH